MVALMALCGRLIPAYAGSTARGWAVRLHVQAHPRLRGEHILHAAHLMCSAWLIPAYAGSTVGAGPASPCGPAHPRFRGEHGVGEHKAT